MCVWGGGGGVVTGILSIRIRTIKSYRWRYNRRKRYWRGFYAVFFVFNNPKFLVIMQQSTKRFF